jgi:hypothetical protein
MFHRKNIIMRKVLLSLFIFILNFVQAQECLEIFNNYINQEETIDDLISKKVFIDTCSSSEYFQRIFTDEYYLYFSENIFLWDTIPEEIDIYLANIDSVNFSESYEKFNNLHNDLGEFKFNRSSNVPDSIQIINNGLKLIFEEPQIIDILIEDFL